MTNQIQNINPLKQAWCNCWCQEGCEHACV